MYERMNVTNEAQVLSCLSRVKCGTSNENCQAQIVGKESGEVGSGRETAPPIAQAVDNVWKCCHVERTKTIPSLPALVERDAGSAKSTTSANDAGSALLDAIMCGRDLTSTEFVLHATTASHMLHVLRRSIEVSCSDERRGGQGSTFTDASPLTSMSSALDNPTEVFLCIQGVTLQFHQWYKERREAVSSLISSLQGQDNLSANSVDGDSVGNRDGCDSTVCEACPSHAKWEEYFDEQTAWYKVWSGALIVLATLSKCCVGPSWHWQLYRRRVALMMAQGHAQMQETMLDASVDGESCLSIGDTLQWKIGRPTTARARLAASENNRSTIVEGGKMLETIYPRIPESLPASMLRFAASASSLAIPPIIRVTSSTTVRTDARGVNEMDGVAGNSLKTTDDRTRNSEDDGCVCTTYYSDAYSYICSLKHQCRQRLGVTETKQICSVSPEAEELRLMETAVARERLWLLRRQAVGESQRDLVLALCCTPLDAAIKECNGVMKSSNIQDTQEKGRPTLSAGELDGACDARIFSRTMLFDGNAVLEKRDAKLNNDGRLDIPVLEGTNKPSYQHCQHECRNQQMYDPDYADRGSLPPRSLLHANPSPSSWSIPGVMMPISLMMRTWVDTARAGWPKLNRGKEEEKRDGTYRHQGASPSDGPLFILSGPIDWYQTLSITRTIADLVSAGWRPPPSKQPLHNSKTGGVGKGQVMPSSDPTLWSPSAPRNGNILSREGEDDAFAIVSRLASIAEEALFSIINEDACKREFDSLTRKKDDCGKEDAAVSVGTGDCLDDAMRERLAAASCAAEAMCALASLGSSGGIRPYMLERLVKKLCLILVRAEEEEEEEERVGSSSDAEVSDEVSDQLSDLEVDEGICLTPDEKLKQQHDAIDRFLNDTTDETVHRQHKSDDEVDVTVQATALIKAQRKACLFDCAELLWTFLSHPECAADTVASLLQIMNVNLSSSFCESTLKAETEHCGIRSHRVQDVAYDAMGAIRTLGSALWGDPPYVSGLPSLRIFWCTTLEQLVKTASSILHHDDYNSGSKEINAIGGAKRNAGEEENNYTRKRFFYAYPELKPVSRFSKCALRVILEVFVALRRLVDGELIESDEGGMLSPLEWKPLIDLLEKGMIPWLSYRQVLLLNADISSMEEGSVGIRCETGGDLTHDRDECKNTLPALFDDDINAELTQRIIEEIEALLLQIQTFLESSSWAQCYLWHDECSQNLKLLLLRGVCPLLVSRTFEDVEDRSFQSKEYILEVSNDFATSSALALSLVRSWASNGRLVPKSGEHFCIASSDLLADAFAVYSEGSCGQHGRHVHSAAVRLEVLWALTWGVDKETVPFDETDGGRVVHFLGRDFNVPRMLSPLVISQHMPELHSELIHGVLLSYLVAIVTNQFQASENDDYNSETNHGISTSPESGCNKSAYGHSPPNVVTLPLPPAYTYTAKGNSAKKTLHAFCQSVNRDELVLKLYAIKLLGILCRSPVAEHLRRPSLLRTLRSFVVENPVIAANVSHESEDESQHKKSMNYADGVNESDRFCDATTYFLTQMEAIKQLDLCLQAGFTDLHAHCSVPLILDSLSDAFRVFATLASDGIKPCVFGSERALQVVHMKLAASAFLPLVRLRAEDGHATMILKSEFVNSHLTSPSTIKSTLLMSDSCSLMDFVFEEHDCDRCLEGSHDEHSICSKWTQTCVEDYDYVLTAPFLFVDRSICPVPYYPGTGVPHLSFVTEAEIGAYRLEHDPSASTTISFAPLFSLITEALRLFSCSVFAHSGLKVDHAVSSCTSSIRTLCFAALEGILCSGIPLPTGALGYDVVESILTIQAVSTTCSDEAVARSHALALLAGLVNSGRGIAPSSFCNDECSQSYFDLFVNELIACCISEDELVMINGCRGLTSLLFGESTLLPQKQILITDICKCILDHLQKFVDDKNSEGDMGKKALVCSVDNWEKTTEHREEVNDTVLAGSALHFAPLLSLLYDIFTVCSQKGCSLPLPHYRQAVVLCYCICAQLMSSSKTVTRHCKLVALQCAAVVLNAIDAFEARRIFLRCRMLSLSSNQRSREKAEKIHGADRNFASILVDLCTRRYSKVTSLNRTSASNLPLSSSLSAHEILSEEADDIESFIVDKSSCQICAAVGAWRFGEALLMLRVGGGMYKGWIEVTVRSAASFIRRLVRLKDCVSLSHPGLAVSHLDEKPVKSELIPFSLSNTERSNTFLNIIPTRQLTDKRRRSLDSMYSSSNKKDLMSERISGHELYSADDLSKFALAAGSQYQLKKMERATSGNLPCKWSTVHEWLGHIYGKSSKFIKDVEEELRLLDLSDDMIGLPCESVPWEVQEGLMPCHQAMQYLSTGSKLDRAVKILDRTSPLYTLKVALLFVGPGGVSERHSSKLSREEVMLGALHGSPSFHNFRRNLGSLVFTRDLKHFSGGIDTSPHATDGEFALVWMSDDARNKNKNFSLAGIMAVFHDVTLMPPGLNLRKRHVGNDAVHIVYFEKMSSTSSCFDTRYSFDAEPSEKPNACLNSISGAFGFVTIYVLPLPSTGFMKVICRVREEPDDTIYSTLSHLVGTSIIPERNSAHFVRQLAIRADMACRSITEDSIGLASNWEDRLIQIRGMNRYRRCETV